ncbi:MAG TPA: hypothetical protein VGJ25_09945 [Gaiellaceae bacterium]|jgi:hypothetical protein
MEVHEKRAKPGLPAEAIEHVISALVAERQHLRSAGADADVLEANRKALTYWHRELADARRRGRAS